MNRLLFTLLFSCTMLAADAQNQRSILALAINYEPDPIDGGDIFLLVDKPRGIMLQPNQTFVCKGIYRSADSDTAIIGNGYIRQITPYRLECIIPAAELKRTPQIGDLCYFLIPETGERTDIFYLPARYAISFSTVADSVLFSAAEGLAAWSQNRTTKVLEAMAADIRFTGKAMLEQSDGQQQRIQGGDYDGKMLFDAMTEIQPEAVVSFLSYVNARPIKYAGHSWRIAEVFATWMTNGTPKPLGK
jgi:hypothetical protein